MYLCIRFCSSLCLTVRVCEATSWWVIPSNTTNNNSKKKRKQQREKGGGEWATRDT